jgi:hypothetical protein
MFARVKADHRYPVVKAFSGQIFVKYEYRPVPKGCEKEAEAHPYFDLVDVLPDPPAPEPVQVSADQGQDSPPAVDPKTSEPKTPPATDVVVKKSSNRKPMTDEQKAAAVARMQAGRIAKKAAKEAEAKKAGE